MINLTGTSEAAEAHNRSERPNQQFNVEISHETAPPGIKQADVTTVNRKLSSEKHGGETKPNNIRLVSAHRLCYHHQN